MTPIVVRLAKPDEADVLTDLAMRAKASWGYSDAFMDACRAELTLSPAKMAAWTVWVAEADRTICGLIALDLRENARAEVEDFFVDPAFQGRGVGTALMSTLLGTCRLHGVRVLGLDADPNAERIYSRLGFVTVGRSPSRSIAGRTLPRMELRLSPE